MVKMQFVGVLDNQEHRFVVDDHDGEDGFYTIELDGKAYEVDAQSLPSEIVSALIANKSYDLELDDKDQSNDPLDGRLSIRVRGRVVRLEILEARRKRMKDAQSSHFGGLANSHVTSPMPGKVLRYLVEVGDEIAEGQGVVVVEAMKMENELCAPRKGVVAALLVEVGKPVESGTKLMLIE